MTRINVVPPKELVRQHLIAEYRELPRIFSLVKRSQNSGKYPEGMIVPDILGPVNARIKIPKAYCLGTGHVLFFYDKLRWLVSRYHKLIQEIECRGYNANPIDDCDLLAGVYKMWVNDWEPDDIALALNRQRIEERKATMKL